MDFFGKRLEIVWLGHNGSWRDPSCWVFSAYRDTDAGCLIVDFWVVSITWNTKRCLAFSAEITDSGFCRDCNVQNHDRCNNNPYCPCCYDTMNPPAPYCKACEVEHHDCCSNDPNCPCCLDTMERIKDN